MPAIANQQQPSLVRLRLEAATLRAQIPSDSDFDAYIAAWLASQREERAQAIARLLILSQAISEREALEPGGES